MPIHVRRVPVGLGRIEPRKRMGEAAADILGWIQSMLGQLPQGTAEWTGFVTQLDQCSTMLESESSATQAAAMGCLYSLYQSIQDYFDGDDDLKWRLTVVVYSQSGSLVSGAKITAKWQNGQKTATAVTGSDGKAVIQVGAQTVDLIVESTAGNASRTVTTPSGEYENTVVFGSPKKIESGDSGVSPWVWGAVAAAATAAVVYVSTAK